MLTKPFTLHLIYVFLGYPLFFKCCLSFPPLSVIRIEAGLSKGDTLTFDVTANFIVDYYDGTKSLVISNTGDLGGEMSYWAESMTTVGIIVLALALVIAVRQTLQLFHL